MKNDWVKLSKLANVSLGYKSLQNNFFYLNSETIDTYKISEDHILPINLLKGMNQNQYIQKLKPSIYLFNCSYSQTDLRGTGALRYITAMRAHKAASKKQSGKNQTIKQALSLQGGKLWYAPKATPHKANIWLRKAFSSIYSPLIFKRASIVDQRCNYISPLKGLSWNALASLMTSNLFAMVIEVNGSSSMGGGALEMTTKKLRDLPVIDLRDLSKLEIKRLSDIGQNVWLNEEPFDWRKSNKPGKYLKQLDKWLLTTIGNPITINQLYSDLHELCVSRIKIAKDKNKVNVKKVKNDLLTVSHNIAKPAASYISGIRFPESFFEGDIEKTTLSFEGYEKLHITIRRFLSDCSLEISDKSGNVIYSEDHPYSIGEIIVKSLMLGRRKFNIPNDEKLAHKILDKFVSYLYEIENLISNRIIESATGTGYEEEVKQNVYRILNLHPSIGDKVLPEEIDITY